ncbi:MAG: hypothetical protein KBD51_01325 [Candidatus Levybacteria bacterium]|nr:hypothetical protein [Candidatus Levybacteria bacterium]
MPSLSETIRSSSPKPQGADGISPNAMRDLVVKLVPQGEHAPRIIDHTQHLTALAPIRKNLIGERPLPKRHGQHNLIER